MQKLNLKILAAFLLVLTHLLLVTSCKDDNSPTGPEQQQEEVQEPVMPPTNSMKIDLSDFLGNRKSGLAKAPVLSKQNFGMAVVTTTVLNTWVVVGLSVPVAIFARALQETPALESDAKFHWRYTELGYEVDLVGWIDIQNKQTVWEMYVTHLSNLDHFLWYSGRANLDATAGDWLFYDISQPATQVEIIKIDWVNNSETDRQLAFTNVLVNTENYGDILKYTVKDDDRKIEFHDSAKDEDLIIYWDAVTTAGYFQAPDYKDGLPAYWDENHDDVP